MSNPFINADIGSDDYIRGWLFNMSNKEIKRQIETNKHHRAVNIREIAKLDRWIRVAEDYLINHVE